ncbi:MULTISPECIES: YARHG domain-containing protein [unclassified Acinetobacter]|uniref:YARHG domain-containing protein n=1 Tax=unclassified Acinetobacter TaxID=196816 RepID=UPI002934A523|nr:MULTISPECIES: YARHG domain-containing protein [unclassified Acinetobacter]WOE31943.1 YARHG domain-containing protein [Acinetobacter sp. SAAs470]WOE37411.1 YARHG domain-containing protein [Acinetobacter sp. SAAs474]
MNKFAILLLGCCTGLFSLNSAFASEQECKKLQQDSDVIYASKGFCFKDPDAKARFNNNADCYTSKPKFSEAEQARLDQIKARQKELQCK